MINIMFLKHKLQIAYKLLGKDPSMQFRSIQKEYVPYINPSSFWPLVERLLSSASNNCA